MSEILDVNQPGAVTAGINVTNFNRLAVYCKKHSGRCKDQVLDLEVTPDGSTWFSSNYTLTGGCQHLDIIAKFVRARVIVPDGEPSEVELFFET